MQNHMEIMSDSGHMETLGIELHILHDRAIGAQGTVAEIRFESCIQYTWLEYQRNTWLEYHTVRII